MSIDFGALNARLLSNAYSLVPSWLPNGKTRGHEYIVGNLSGDAGTSLSINLDTGQWADFAADARGGDLVSLYAAIRHLSQPDAARELDDSAPTQVKKVKSTKAVRDVVLPVPKGTPDCSCFHYKFKSPVAIWTYRNAAGDLLGYVARYEPNGDKKQIAPWTYARDAKGAGKWGMGQWPEPRSMYNLDDLAARPDAPVLLVEGEKSADAARAITPQYVVMTWPGGAQAWHKVDWSPLKGRSVLLWPDCDKPGVDAMWAIGHELLAKHCPTVKIVMAAGQSEGWDAADAAAEGWDWDHFKEWAVPLIQQLVENGGGQRGTETTVGNAGSDVASEDRSVSPVVPAAGRAAEGHGRNGDGPGAAAAKDSTDPGASRGAADNPGVRDGDGKGAAPAQRAQVNWYAWGLDLNGSGVPLTNLSNAVAILEKDPTLAGSVWFDTFLQRILTNVDAPREWTEADDINLTLDMQRRHGLARMNRETVSQAVIAIAMRNLKSCVKDWLSTLEWDNEPRMEHFFEDHFGAPGTEYTRAVSKNFFLSLVARAFIPGCQVDNMVVLEGAQGVYKSQSLKTVGGAWFSKQQESVTDPKAFAELLQGKWLVEIDEMSSFKRSGELSSIKAMVSTQSDRFRPAYGRYAKDQPRQCIFVGTTNETDWNKDDSGARRFWPIAVKGEIDIAGVAACRSQVLAEAVARFLSVPLDAPTGVRVGARADWWHTPVADTQTEQMKRFDMDPWTDSVEEYLGGRLTVSIPDLLINALDLKKKEINSGQSRRVAAILRFLDWEHQGNVREGHTVRKIWKRRQGVLGFVAAE